MFVEYQFNRDTTDDPFNLLGGITNLPSFGVHDALQTQTFRVNNTHVFSAGLVDQFRFSAGYLEQPRTILGDQNVAVPAVLMTDYSHFGHATNLPQERQNRSFEFANDVSWQHGASQTKFGATVRHWICTAAASTSLPAVFIPIMRLRIFCSDFQQTRCA
jgi:hypothetical protein